MSDKLLIFSIICIWIIWRFYKIKNKEFLILYIFLSLILYRSVNNTEFFYNDDFTFNKLFEIPKYIEKSIGGGLDKIIQASKPNISDNDDVNNMAFLSPELFLNDDTLLTNNKVDNSKYNLLVNNYLTLDSTFDSLKKQYTNAYNIIFPEI